VHSSARLAGDLRDLDHEREFVFTLIGVERNLRVTCALSTAELP